MIPDALLPIGVTITSAASRWKRIFLAALAGVILVRLVLAAVLPLTGDEAYFYFWGARPDLGFYDHPPMVGWLLGLVHPIAPYSVFWARLASVLLIVPVTLVVVALAHPFGSDRAWIAGLCTLAVTPEWLNVLISTDTPLVLFSILSVLAYSLALRSSRVINGWYVAAGVLLGLALLSKYFAVLLALGYLAFALVSPRAERRWPGLLIVAACAVPFVALNVWWNYGHCWANIMFNLYNRHERSAPSWRTPLLYLVTLAYATSPLILWQLLRRYTAIRGALADPGVRLVATVVVVPLAIFALLSIPKTIGLHWLFSFAPLVFVLGARVLEPRQLLANLKLLAVIAALHLAALVVVAVMPIETWSRLRIYEGAVLTTHASRVLAALGVGSAPERVLASDSYSNAVVVGFAARRPAAVFGRGSGHARHDDIVTDFSALDGRDFVVVRKSPPPPEDYAPFFDSVIYREAVVHGARFYAVEGTGFRYAPYRDRVLSSIRDRYYRIPGFLPQGECYFCARYFGSTSCPVR